MDTNSVSLCIQSACRVWDKSLTEQTAQRRRGGGRTAHVHAFCPGTGPSSGACGNIDDLGRHDGAGARWGDAWRAGVSPAYRRGCVAYGAPPHSAPHALRCSCPVDQVGTPRGVAVLARISHQPLNAMTKLFTSWMVAGILHGLSDHRLRWPRPPALRAGDPRRSFGPVRAHATSTVVPAMLSVAGTRTGPKSSNAPARARIIAAPGEKSGLVATHPATDAALRYRKTRCRRCRGRSR